MPEEKKYGFKEVDKLSGKEVRLKPIHLLYIIFFSLCYFYISISIIDYFDYIDFYYRILWIMCIYGIILTFIIGGFYKSLAKTVKSKKYAAMMDEKSLLEEKFKNVLDKNPIALEDYIRAFISIYGNEYYKNITSTLEFKRLIYLRKVITYEQFINDSSLREIILLIEENDRLKEKFKQVLNENPDTPIDYLKVFFHIYGSNYLEYLDDFKRLLRLQAKLIFNEADTQKLIDSIEKRHTSMFIDIMFENMLSNNSTPFKHYLGKFMSVYGSNYAENLQIFKGMMFKKNISYIEVENEIPSYFKSIISNKCSFKSIYGFEPAYDFKLIHDFAKKYGTSYSEEDLENLNKLLITKGIKIHNKAILKELVSEASFEYFYGLFTECMKTAPLDEMGYIKQTINLFGNDIDYQLPFLHRYFMERNLTSLDYKNFEEHIKTKIFELNLLSSEKQLSILDVNGMGGYEFEAFVGQLYEKMGYSVEQTPLSNDQGADLIISKYGEKTAVQVKKYTSNVSNSAVQQVVAAKKYYGCSSCSVVTNSYFTKSAIELADANGVKLVDRDELNYLINNKAIKIDQKSASAWNSKGFALTDAGRYEEAIQAYDKAIEINPRSDSAWDSKGWALRSLGRDEEAIQEYDKAIEINPRSASIWNSKGLALSSLGRDEEAIQAFDKVIEIDSKYPHAWDNKGLALSTLGRDEEAIQAYDKAIEIDPKFEGPWSSKGFALSSLGRYEEAIQAYDKAIEINPRSASIWSGKGLALSILGRYEEAIQAYDKVIEINPRSDSAWDSKGLALSSLGRYEEAIQAFDKAIEVNPKSDISWANTGYVLSSLGKYEEAMCAFDKAIEIDSMSEIAWVRMGFALTDAGRYEEAIQAFDVVIEINPKSSVIWHTKGFALRSLGREEEAIQAFDRAKELGYTE